MHYIFVVPEYDSFVSGGNIYNKFFISAISAIAKVETTNWDKWQKTITPRSVVIIDSIYIDLMESENESIRKNTVLLLHYLDIFYDEKNNDALISKRLKQLCSFEYFIVTGQFGYEWLVQRGINKEKIFSLRPMIQIEGSKKTHHYALPKRILMAGNLLPVKGYLSFLEELDLQKPKDIQITIIGDKTIDISYAKAIEKQIDNSAYLKEVCHIAGTIAHGNMTAYFENYDILISASYFETFGMSIHEALLYGLPVWAIASGNIVNIYHPLLKTFTNHKEIVKELVLAKNVISKIQITKIEIPLYNPSWTDSALHFHTRLTGLTL